MPEKLQELLGCFAGCTAQVQHDQLQDSFRFEALLTRCQGPLRVWPCIPYARPEGIDALWAEGIEDCAGDQALDPLEGLRMHKAAFRPGKSTQEQLREAI